MSHYLARVGEGSKYIDEAKKGGFVAIGWKDLKIDLGSIQDIEKLKNCFSSAFINSKIFCQRFN